MLGSRVDRPTSRRIRPGSFPLFDPNGVEEPPIVFGVVPPDIGFQIKIPLSLDIVDLDADGLESLLQRELSKDFSDLEVRVSITEEEDSRQLLSAGVWVSPGSATEESLQDGLAALDLFGDEPTLATAFALFLSGAYIKRQTRVQWDAKGKRFNAKGKADENGSVHLTGLQVRIESPTDRDEILRVTGRVVSTLTGYDDRTFPDVNFTITIVDGLLVDENSTDGRIECRTESDLDIHNDFFYVATIASALLGGILGGIMTLIFGAQAILTGERDLDREEGAAGCALAAGLPLQILIPKSFGIEKLEFSYESVSTTQVGLFAGGRWNIAARTPAVSIVGPSLVQIRVTQTKTKQRFGISSIDLRGDRSDLDIAWSNGETGPDATFEFSSTGLPVGSTRTERISLQVKDMDDVEIEAEKDIVIEITDVGGPGGPTHPL
jgi:hypothetical protein